MNLAILRSFSLSYCHCSHWSGQSWNVPGWTFAKLLHQFFHVHEALQSKFAASTDCTLLYWWTINSARDISGGTHETLRMSVQSPLPQARTLASRYHSQSIGLVRRRAHRMEELTPSAPAMLSLHSSTIYGRKP